jgi:replicative DNA helicase
VILPDADDAGRKYAEEVLGLLLALDPPARAAIAPLPGLTLGEDAVEFVERVHGSDAGAARTAIDELAASALATAMIRATRITFAELLNDPQLRTKPETIASGWGAFDRAQPFEAIERGAKVVLAAPPGCYKTATMLRMARGFAEQGHRVAWMAAEMQPRALLRRMLCQLARVGQSAIFSECSDHIRKFAIATQRLQGFAHRIECTSAPIGFKELERAAGGAEVVFVDYLQLVRHPERDARGHEKLEEVMGHIAELSQREGAVFIIASAQGREGGGDTRSIHNATRGSSSIEFTVDALYCASKPEPTNGGTLVEFKCLKQREGEALPIEVPIDVTTGAIAEEVQS